MPEFFDGPEGRRIAYHFSPGVGPVVVFLGGFMSDMEGSKAVHLEALCRAQGGGFLRFDYSGHGESAGQFREGAIGDWAADAMAVMRGVVEGPMVLVGSSMGGWISLLCSRAMPERVVGLVTIAAAPDFTEDGYWAGFDAVQRAALERDGFVAVPSEYGEPYIITKRLIEEGRDQLVLRSPLDLQMPVRFLQGTEDEAVSVDVAVRLLAHAEGPDMRLLLVKGKDHRFSDEECLGHIEAALGDVLERCAV